MILNTRYFGEGKKDGGPGIEEEQHVESLFTVLAHLYAFSLSVMSDYFPWMRVLDLDGHEKTVRQAMNTIDKYHDPIVENRAKQWRNGGKKEAEDLLDIFLSIKDAHGEPLLSVAEIKANAHCCWLLYSQRQSCLLSRLGLGRNGRIWEEPLRFKPERHLSEGTGKMVELTEPDFDSFPSALEDVGALEKQRAFGVDYIWTNNDHGVGPRGSGFSIAFGMCFGSYLCWDDDINVEGWAANFGMWPSTPKVGPGCPITVAGWVDAE
ncbi:Phenylalanine N-monooxygenase [Vitis vinifera]|uniref:Phenylalanine N-monooxygenase n=1 Tax=Vitis vinifera TaxID=29760 RepID=A0A438FM16_VITVI|nr:Phenylalanine N-monooxygenase [Vitis vinifera]